MPKPEKHEEKSDSYRIVKYESDEASEYNDFEIAPQTPFTTNIKGRSSGFNPPNRFDTQHQDKSIDDITKEDIDPERTVPTELIEDKSRTILSKNDSPDIPFTYGINPYRGCEHGCVYCYARPSHEFLGHSLGLDFETKIHVKYDAAKLLEKEFLKPSWKAEPIAFSSNTDCYQPIERKLKITRACLEVFLKYRNPVRMITKNYLITRDLDIISQLSKLNLFGAMISITTLDTGLARRLEPRTSRPDNRLKAIELLAKNNIPVGVLTAPIIPGLNDHEIPEILRRAADSGATSAGYTVLRLPYQLRELFSDWLTRNEPNKKEKILHAIQSVRGGKLNNTEFGKRMRGEGNMADHISNLFNLFYKKYGFDKKVVRGEPAGFLRGGVVQESLF